MEVGVWELRNHLSRYLDRVRDGDEAVVTDRGRAIARVVPVDLGQVGAPGEPVEVDLRGAQGLADAFHVPGVIGRLHVGISAPAFSRQASA
jgi:prevent-host-death family protein